MSRRPELKRAVLARNGRREGAEIRFQCPYPSRHNHGDANPSARYHPMKGVWRCDVCDESGGWKSLAELLGVEGAQRGEIVATYAYTDEEGSVLFEVVRTAHPKGFFQRRPDGRGGWINNVKGVRRVLYRLPEVIAAVKEARTIYLAEGEKDADNLARRGLVATTNPGGAGKWAKAYSKVLRRAQVVIFPDNDKTGREHAWTVARALHDIAAEVRIVALPDLLPEGDVSDWIANEKAAGRREEEIRACLEELATGSPPWEPDEGPEDEADETTSAGNNGDKATQAEILIQLSEEGGVGVFHTPDRDGFALLPVADHQETWRIQSKAFKYWLLQRYYTLTGKAPNSQALNDARNTLAARAVFEGEEHEVHTRLAESGGAVYLDLCNEAWEAVEITGTGWRVVSEPPVRFRRSQGILALPRPVPGGSIAELRTLVNLPDDDSFALFVAFLVAALRPRGPYPILVLHGEQGSAKSTLARMARALIDPAGAPLRTLPRNERDLMISASHGWLLAFDNLSGLPDWLSDAFCRLATGGGFSTRELYTDCDEIIFSAMRPVVLNGIDDIVGRQDLVDRSLIQSLPTIPDERRRREDELWSEFVGMQPRLLGALLDAVSCALRRQATVRLDRPPRMADFAHWVVAAEPALPWPAGRFLDAYEDNRSEAIVSTLEGNEVAVAVRELVAEIGEAKGTATEILQILNRRASESSQRAKGWPKSPRSLSSRLRRVAPSLRRTGIEIVFDRDGGRRVIRLTQKDGGEDRHLRHLRHLSRNDGLRHDANGSTVTQDDANAPAARAGETGDDDADDAKDASFPTPSDASIPEDEELLL